MFFVGCCAFFLCLSRVYCVVRAAMARVAWVGALGALVAASAAQDIVPFSPRLAETQYQDTVHARLLPPTPFPFV